MKPKLEASKELKRIMSSLTKTNEKNFSENINNWYKKYEQFLAEKTVSSTTGKLQYTHPRLRSAYKSLTTNIPYLFTYKNKKYKHLKIQNTTNSIEGGIFSHMKNMVSLHRGITKGKKLTLVDFYLMNLGKK
jgi:pyruvate-formate lyase